MRVLLSFLFLVLLAGASPTTQADDYTTLTCASVRTIADASHLVGRLDLRNREEGGHLIDLEKARSESDRLLNACQSNPTWLARHAASQLFEEIAEEEGHGLLTGPAPSQLARQ